MSWIRVTTAMAAAPERVWAEVADIESQPRWMQDAVAIRFSSAQRSGVGTAFECDTRVGPLRLVDRMEITDWDPPRALGIRHVGIVTGRGRFLLEPTDGGTRFTWEEELTFPWWLGAGAGGRLAAPVLAAVWRRSLHALKSLVERSPAV